MIPLIDGEEVEAASFTPAALRLSTHNILRKWQAEDIVTRAAVDTQIGGGTFGERQKKCFVRHKFGQCLFIHPLDGFPAML